MTEGSIGTIKWTSLTNVNTGQVINYTSRSTTFGWTQYNANRITILVGKYRATATERGVTVTFNIIVQ